VPFYDGAARLRHDGSEETAGTVASGEELSKDALICTRRTGLARVLRRSM
jgi:hypothetical protein